MQKVKMEDIGGNVIKDNSQYVLKLSLIHI